MDKLNAIKPESPLRFYCFQGKREKYEQHPKIRSFQIKTNKMPEIIGVAGYLLPLDLLTKSKVYHTSRVAIALLFIQRKG